MGCFDQSAFGRLNALAPSAYPDVVETTQNPDIDRDGGQKEQKDQGNVHVFDMGMLSDPIKKELAPC